MSNFLEKEKAVGREAKDKVAGYIVAGFGLVAALAWNDAITSLINYFFPNKDGGLLLKFVYALVFTIILIVVSKILIRDAEKKDPA